MSQARNAGSEAATKRSGALGDGGKEKRSNLASSQRMSIIILPGKFHNQAANRNEVLLLVFFLQRKRRQATGQLHEVRSSSATHFMESCSSSWVFYEGKSTKCGQRCEHSQTKPLTLSELCSLYAPCVDFCNGRRAGARSGSRSRQVSLATHFMESCFF